jgi:hypothetical protein
MKNDGAFPALVAATLVVAALATVLIDGGWMIWLPVLAALAVIAKIARLLK